VHQPLPAKQVQAYKKEFIMLWTVAVILLVLWAVGLITSFTINGFIHILLVLAIITVLIRIIQGKNVLK